MQTSIHTYYTHIFNVCVSVLVLHNTVCFSYGGRDGNQYCVGMNIVIVDMSRGETRGMGGNEIHQYQAGVR